MDRSDEERDGRNRRHVLCGVAAFTAGLVLGRGASAQDATTGLRFSAVRVDTRPVVALGGGSTAAAVQRVLPGKLQEVFADRLGAAVRGAPVLIARIDQVYLSAFGDTPPPGFSYGSLDFIDGAGVVTAGGKTLSVMPLHAPLPASYSGAYYLPDIDARRIDSLCYQFAYWLRREMNL